MKRILFYINLSIITLAMCYNAQAQTTLPETLSVSGTVVDEFGEPLKNVIVRSSIKSAGQLTDAKGAFSVICGDDDYITFSKQGVASKTIEVVEGSLQQSTIVLQSSNAIAKDEKLTVAYGQLPFDRLTGSVDRVTREDIQDFPTFYALEALSGRLSGVNVGFGETTMGSESFNVTLRNESVANYVDGLPTSTISNAIDEIDEIIIAKDYGSTALFGPTATTGALFINTQRGDPGELQVKMSMNTGVRTPTFLPDMMNSYEYASTINQARINDGDLPIYDAAALDAYYTGSNQLRYPTHDYYSELVDNPAIYQNAGINLTGGSKAVQYNSYLGYYGTSGIESVGYGRNTTNFRVNNNVVINLGSDVKVDLGIGGSYDKYTGANISSDDVFTTMYNYPTNAMPWMINESTFAKTSEYTTNLLADLGYQSQRETEIRNTYMRLGFNYNLGKVVEGLSFSALVGMTVDNSISRTLTPTVTFAIPVWTTDENGDETIDLTSYSVGTADQTWGKSADAVWRNRYINVGLNYDRSFDNDKHQVNAVLNYTSQRDEYNSTIQIDKERFSGLRVNYMYDQKYVIEGNAVLGDSRTLDITSRTELFYTGGLAWLMHKEGFLKDASWVDYLKFRANAGVMGVSFFQIDGSNTSYFLYEDLYESAGAGGDFGVLGGTTTGGGRGHSATGAEEGSIAWPKRINISVGVDYVLFNGHLQGQVNYFNNRYTDQLVIPTNYYAILGTDSAYLPYMNISDTETRGFDMRISYKDNIGDFKYIVDFNAMYATEYVNSDNVYDYDDQYSYRNVNNSYGDRIMGLDAVGLFTDEQQVADATTQTFGSYGVGDIQYTDYNGDGVIDNNDIHEIGHDPRFSFGLNFGFQYKNFGLSINTDGVLGGQRVNTLLWDRGTNNYIADAVNAYPASEKYPQISLVDGNNNYVNSSFWLVSASYLNLRSVTFSYNFPAQWMTKRAIKSAKVYIAGKNLATLSADNLTYPLLTSSGYTVSPVLNAIELGVDVTF